MVILCIPQLERHWGSLIQHSKDLSSNCYQTAQVPHLQISSSLKKSTIPALLSTVLLERSGVNRTSLLSLIINNWFVQSSELGSVQIWNCSIFLQLLLSIVLHWVSFSHPLDSCVRFHIFLIRSGPFNPILNSTLFLFEISSLPIPLVPAKFPFKRFKIRKQVGSVFLLPLLSFCWDPCSSKEMGLEVEKFCKYPYLAGVGVVLYCLLLFLCSKSISLWCTLNGSQPNTESLLEHTCEFFLWAMSWEWWWWRDPQGNLFYSGRPA